MSTLKPKPGFQWGRVAWGHPESVRSALCSYCFAAIGEDEVPLMLMPPDGRVAQFCHACVKRWWGME